MVDVDFPITETDARVDILATNGSFYEAHNVMMNSLLYTFDGSANDGGGFAQINIKSRCKETGPCGKVSEGGYCPTAFLSNGLQAADVAGNCEADSTAAQEPMDLNLVMYTKASCCLTPGCTMFMTLRETCPDINYQTADVTNNNAPAVSNAVAAPARSASDTTGCPAVSSSSWTGRLAELAGFWSRSLAAAPVRWMVTVASAARRMASASCNTAPSTLPRAILSTRSS